MQTQALSVDVGLKTALANLDADAQSRVQNLAAQLQTQGLSADQALRSALANQQQFAETQKMAEQSRQFGTEAGLKGVQQFTQAGALTGELAAREAQADIALKQLQSQIASLEQQGRQAEIDSLIAKFQEEQQMPFKQLGFMSDILRGTSALQGGRAIYEAPQSFAQQAIGVGLPAYAMYRGLTEPTR
jgi:hypothetical protein